MNVLTAVVLTAFLALSSHVAAQPAHNRAW